MHGFYCELDMGRPEPVVNLPSCAGAGVDSFDFAASFGFAFAFANDLKMSPAVLFFVPVDLVESDLFNVVGTAAG